MNMPHPFPSLGERETVMESRRFIIRGGMEPGRDGSVIIGLRDEEEVSLQ